jgi:hypothetical protein
VITVGLLAATTQAWAASPWQIQSTINPDGVGVFYAVSSISSTNTWAVGSGDSGETLIEHYDGTSWTVQPSPTNRGEVSIFYGVKATSSTNAWAVGYASDVGHTFASPIIAHYDGTVWGSQVSAGDPSETGLNAVGASSSTNAWAVGQSDNEPFAEHYDGSTWKSVSVPLPSGAPTGILQGVTLTSQTTAWAVGWYDDSAGIHKTLIEHYNGTKWSRVTSPNPGALPTLTGVSNNSPSDIWAVGYFDGALGPQRTLIVHYDGTKWSYVSSLNRSFYYNLLEGVRAVSSSDVWAVGFYLNNFDLEKTLIEHWDGTSWTVQASPNGPGEVNELWGVGSNSTTGSFAVGVTNGANNTLAMECPC